MVLAGIGLAGETPRETTQETPSLRVGLQAWVERHPKPRSKRLFSSWQMATCSKKWSRRHGLTASSTLGSTTGLPGWLCELNGRMRRISEVVLDPTCLFLLWAFASIPTVHPCLSFLDKANQRVHMRCHVCTSCCGRPLPFARAQCRMPVSHHFAVWVRCTSCESFVERKTAGNAVFVLCKRVTQH